MTKMIPITVIKHVEGSEEEEIITTRYMPVVPRMTELVQLRDDESSNSYLVVGITNIVNSSPDVYQHEFRVNAYVKPLVFEEIR